VKSFLSERIVSKDFLFFFTEPETTTTTTTKLFAGLCVQVSAREFDQLGQ